MELKTTTAVPSTTQTYADSVNYKFNTSKDEIVGLQARFNAAFKEELIDFLPDLLEEFRDRFPQYSQFTDMYQDMVQMPSEGRIKLSQLLINATIQRELDADWIINILGKFDPFFVNIVRVYPKCIHSKAN